MTHLRIEQNNGVIEEVSSSVITKLYEIAHAGLDVSSNLQGRLHTSVAYRHEIQYLTGTYPNLYISADNYAIPFEDPNMVTYLNSIGVGSNGTVTEAQAAAATVAANSKNTEVTKFNELKYFTNITQSSGGWTGTSGKCINFVNWTALEEVDISNFTSLGHVHGSAWDDTFVNCTALKTVTASDKLTQIGHNAFFGCTNLEHITGLSGTIQISSNAFYNCSKLPDEDIANVEFEPAYNGTTLMGVEAFAGTNFTEITLSSNTTSIPSKCFNGCSNLETLTGLQNVTNYGAQCFYNCTKFTGPIDFTNVTTIGDLAFCGCSNFQGQLNFPSLTNLGSKVFWGCGASQINIPDNITYYGESLFRQSGITSFIIPDTVTGVSAAVFMDCKSLQSVVVGSGLIKIGDSMFYGCTSLSSITIKEGVQKIGGSAFRQTAITNIELPSTINEVTAGEIFNQCSSLNSITFKSAIPPTIARGTFDGSGNCPIYVPSTSLNDYKTAQYWSNQASRIFAIPA